MSTMSPELALVDPELRANAVASLPPIYANAFLELRDLPVEHRSSAPPSIRPSAAVAAYLLLAVVRTVVFDATVFAAVFAAVLLANLFA